MTGVGTANAVVMLKVPITDHDENGVLVSISVMEGWVELGDVYHIYVGCDDWDDPSSGVRIEFEVTSMDPLKVTTTIPGGGDDGVSEQRADPYNEVTAFRMQVCTDHLTGQIKAGVVSAPDPQAWALVDPGPGLYVGVGHNNTGHQNHFDDFNMEELRLPTEVCADCWCWCLRRVPFRHMTATIRVNWTYTPDPETGAPVPDPNRADCMDGLTWPMDWEYESSLEQWVGTVDIPSAAGSGGGTQAVTWRLKCDAYDDDNPSWPGHNWLLYADNMDCQFSTTGGIDGQGTFRANSDSECDPEMVLRFGPFTMAKSELSCYLCYPPDPLTPPSHPDDPDAGSFYVEITE